MNIPTVEFGRIQNRLSDHWRPREYNPHQAIFGQTGSGKSWLIRNRILPVRPIERVLLIDVKSGQDRTWSDFGAPVEELPPGFHGRGTGPARNHYRLTLNRPELGGRAQLARALAQVRDEGHCVLIVDESRGVTEQAQYGQGSALENLILEGRALGVSVIAGAQDSAWLPPALKTQAGVLWLGQMRSRPEARKLANLANLPDLAGPILATPARGWLYVDYFGAAPLVGRGA